MRTILFPCAVFLLSILSSAQQFQLEATLDNNIRAVFDIDGDGVCEYIADTNKVYDGATHQLKYTLPLGYAIWDNQNAAQNPYSNFPHIDFNGDGKRDLIIITYSGQENTLMIYDAVNDDVLYEFDPQENNVDYKDLIDIDGDSELEIIIDAEGISSFHTYIISTGITTSLVENSNYDIPSHYKLMQNFPNPFNPSTTIRYSLSGPENISIKIFDVSGQLVKEINKDHNQAGEYEVIWDGKNNFGEKVSSGAYFYQIVAGNYVEAKKMIMLK